MVQLYADVLLMIMLELQDDISSLHSCVLVNKSWSRIAVFFLWKYISRINEITYSRDRDSRVKLYKVIANFLPIESENLLINNNIILPSYKLPRKPTFEYMNYFTQITPYWIRDMVQLFIKEDSTHKKNLLETQIYNLIFVNCKNINHFHLSTDIEFYKFPSVGSFFLNLQSLLINFDNNNMVTSKTLFELATICQNIKTLEVFYCNEDSKGLALFIEMQHNLRSLFLNFIDNKNKYPLLSNVVKKKAATLKTLMTTPLIDPGSFLSLINLQHLELINHDGNEPYNCYKNVDWKQWEDCLDKASFPNLRIFEATLIPSSIECLIIEKSDKSIIEIDICCSREFQDYRAKNLNLIIIISKYCPNLRSLNLDIDPGNLCEIDRIFSNCTVLEKLSFNINVSTLSDDGDYLLEIISNKSPLSLREFSGDDWNFSKDGLEAFFNCWKCKKRNPIKFTHRYMDLWHDDQKNVVSKYMKEGVIKL
ncbi:uncharacterized protein OCT59_026732 [Rhizophagus irregularis]|nr:hypothetical protein OCT59_026732 [Rhizophagus irregularis]GBC16414.2 hypothetical protein GLOIN_2v1827418 [Rhizophagus irregularis DAOM 181602=DAOM 197198]CAB5193461.1 unnamed protein product [Rhizophagus irregularis]